ncbi:hypothetical protein ICM05_05340 [Leucobacter sp. cx-42]|uniref:hypothetical protein n=1 Tax=unclassified Leucobacter TaxID=2621730 RepID=UPI00165E7C88|nr:MULTISPECIES: hypothetical protein [unclassified Leucobacter]MBC9954070.1 hypothetical protein [Leucobacter sp. cx-42]
MKEKLGPAERKSERAVAMLERIEQQLMDDSSLSPRQKERLEEKKQEAKASVEGAQSWLKELKNLIEVREAVKAEREQRAADKLQEKADAVQEREEHGRRKAANSGQTKRPSQRLALTELELGDLKAEAKASGMTATAFVAGLFSSPPSYRNVRAEDENAGLYNLTSGEGSGKVGRKPVSNRASVENSPNISMRGEALLRAEAEARVFKLSLSDLIRKRIMRQDPRERGRHLGKISQEIAVAEFIQSEKALKNEATVEDIEAHYEALIQEEMEVLRQEK